MIKSSRISFIPWNLSSFLSFENQGFLTLMPSPTSPPLLKITKKHHKHLNNPFPGQPKSIPSSNGILYSNQIILQHNQIFPIGTDFQLSWTSIKESSPGHYLSISHNSQPKRILWSTIPGEAFVSTAIVQTEVEESRGSFAVKDGHVHVLCDNQSVEKIGVLNRDECEKKWRDEDDILFGFPFDHSKNDSFDILKETQFPICVITGRVFGRRKKKKGERFVNESKRRFRNGSSRKVQHSVSAKYWVVLDQKKSSQIGFHVKLEDIIHQQEIDKGPKSFRIFNLPRWKHIRRIRKRRLSCFSKPPKGFNLLSSDEDEGEEDSCFFGSFNRIILTYASEEDEMFFGFGEQFSHVEFKGKKVPIFVQEQGIGRGDQPITFAANLVSYRAGGDWSTTYAPSPFYMTSKMRSIYLEGYDYSVFDLTKSDRVQIQIHSDSARGRILKGDLPTEVIETYTEAIGRTSELPNWIISGAVVGMQGGTEAVRRVWDKLKDYDVPVSAFWLQDWVGERKTMIGSQLWWNWELDKNRYSYWSQLVKDLRASDIRVMAYCNPCLAPTDVKPEKSRNMFEEASKLGILVKERDDSTYMIPNTAFDVGMLDFTNPEAVRWFKGILQEMVDCGIRGWMADFGEGLPLDATTHSGEDAISAHNRYPELWARVNREFVDEWESNRHLKEKEEDPEESLVFFMRAGFRGSQKWAMLFWEGDQMVSWQKNDGIKSSVIGLLSSGISGFALNHSDIGGYCTANLGLVRYHRSEELLLRWMELNAFNIVYRTHEGNRPSFNCQFYSNHRTLSQFARFAKVYKAWMFYRVQLVKEAATKGLPVTRHLFLHYPKDEHVHTLSYEQFLVGSEILVVPVLDKGRKKVKVYFPLAEDCSWQHIWTGSVFNRSSSFSGCKKQGFEAWVDAPIGYPAVFVKYGSHIGKTFMKNLRELNVF